MGFYKTENENEIIIVVENDAIDDDFVNSLFCTLNCAKKVGLDMRNVKAVKSRVFVEKLLDGKFRLYNLESEILAYLSIVLKDGFLKSYMSYSDFKENKRELIRRKLFVA